ncbi:MAG: hypothetical protein AAF487_08960 [Bacteroidota bacterium]
MKKTLIILFTLGVTQMAFAGGWVKSKGTGYYKLYQWWTVFDQHYTDQGLIDPNVTMGLYNTSLYAEHGLSDRITLQANIPLFSRNIMNNLVSSNTGNILAEGDALNSIGDIDLGFKYGFNQSKTPIAVTLMLGLPTGNELGGIMENLQTGDGEFNQILRFDISRSFQIKKLNTYFNAYSGFNNRSEGFSDEFRYGFELGSSFNKYSGNVKVFAVESLKNGDSTIGANSTSVFANNSEFSAVAIEGAYAVTDKFGLSLGFSYAFRGEIIAAAPSYSIGVFFDTSK